MFLFRVAAIYDNLDIGVLTFLFKVAAIYDSLDIGCQRPLYGGNNITIMPLDCLHSYLGWQQNESLDIGVLTFLFRIEVI